MNLYISSTFFLYNDNYYSQTFGTAMGLPITSTVANLVIEELVNEIITS